MKKLLVAAALSALCASAAMAQDHHDHGGGHDNGAHNAPPQNHAPAPQAAPAMHREDHPSNAMAGPRPDHNGPDHNRANFNRPDNRPDNRPTFNRPDTNRPAFNPPNNRPGPNRPAANAPHRNFSSYHRNFVAPHRFHAPVYRRPRGFYVHHWNYGEVLPSPFWVQDYWLTDFYDFGLMPPPPGTVWVRYGDDALLIDEYNGEVIQVAYNVFY